MGSKGTMNAVATLPTRPPRSMSRVPFVLVTAIIVLLSASTLVQAQDGPAANEIAVNGHIETLVNDRIEKIFNDRIEEIIVVGERPESNANLFRRLYEDPLTKRIRDELRQLDLLEEEFAWRRETADQSTTPDRVRVGYDPRDALRAGLMPVEFLLPLDLVQPASLVRVDF